MLQSFHTYLLPDGQIDPILGPTLAAEPADFAHGELRSSGSVTSRHEESFSLYGLTLFLFGED